MLIEVFILLDLPIPAGGEVIFVGLHLILGHPELAAELIDLRLQRRNAGLEFGEFGLGFLAGGAGLIRRLRDDLVKLEPMDDLVVNETVNLERGYLLLNVGKALGALLLELRIAPVAPTFQHVGDVILGNLLTLVVQ